MANKHTVFFSADIIAEKVNDLAARIDRDYSDDGLVVVVVLKGAAIAKKKVKKKVLKTDDLVNGIISIADKYDVVVLGSNNLAQLPRLVASTSRATFSI